MVKETLETTQNANTQSVVKTDKATVKTVEPTTPIQKKPRSTRRRASALSLKSLTEKVEAVADTPIEEIDRNTLPKTKFTETKMQEVWVSFTKLLIKGGDKSLASILAASQPKLKDFHIYYTLPNSLMADQLERLKPKLLKYLRNTLNNFSIDLTVKVEASVEKKFVYTPQEKFKKMLENNPDIELLKKAFKLDV